MLIGLVLVAGTVVILAGSYALDDMRVELRGENAEHAMREVDSRLSRVAFSDNDVETLDFGQSDGETEIRSTSHMNVTVNGSSQCAATIEMGSIVREVEDGREVAYEGGGVWRKSGNGSTMVSPPDFQYRNGTINFPLVSVDNSVSGGGDTFRADKNVTASRKRSRQITKNLTEPASVCQPASNITITVRSEYYLAWGNYFNDVTDEPVSYDHGNRTATVLLSKIGPASSAQLTGNNVTSDTDYVANIKINGTAYHANQFHLPVGFQVEVDGETPKAFSADYTEPDGTRLANRPIDMSYTNPSGVPVADDMNNPMVSHENRKYPTESISVESGKSFAVVGFSYYCKAGTSNELARADGGGDEPDSENITNENGDGMLDTDPVNPPPSGNDDRCIASGLNNRELRNLSTAGGNTQSDNLLVFNESRNLVTKYIDYDDFTSGSSDQRNVQEVVADIYQEHPDDSVPGHPGYSDSDGYKEITLDLKSNQALYIYEFNEDPDLDPNTFNGDFNDAVVLITVYEQGTISQSGSFSIKISTSKVTIQET
jgi:hypothetical protein